MTVSFTKRAAAITFRHRDLMNQQQKLEIGQRIKELRDNSPETNRSIADYCEVAERSVAHWIAGDGITYDNAEKVAELFQTTIDYIWRGREKPETPDVMGLLTAGSGEAGGEDLEKLRSQIDLILDRQSSILAQLADDRVQLERALAIQAEQSSRISQALLVLGEIRTRLERIERGQEGTGS